MRWDIPALAGYGTVTQTTMVVTATSTLTNSVYSVSASGGFSASGVHPVTTRLVRAKSIGDPLRDATLYTQDGNGRRILDIIIPPGAVFEETVFTLDELAEPGYPLPTGLSYAGRAFRLGAYQGNQPASGLLLGEAISMTVAYDGANSASLHNGTPGLYYWDGSQWTQEGLDCTASNEQQQLACVYSAQQLTHFALASSTAVEPPAETGKQLYLPVIVR